MRLLRVAFMASLPGLVTCLAGCGSSSPASQPAARDQAAQTACSYYMRCGQIGAGLKYTSEDDCLTQVKAYFNTAWPQDTCTSISTTGFDDCIAAINIADCDSVADFLNVTVNKCTADNVCVSGGAG